MMREPEAARTNEPGDLEGRRAKLEEARGQLSRAEQKLVLLEKKLENHRTAYREAKRRGAPDTELREAVRKGEEISARVEAGRGYVGAEREKLDRIERIVAHREREDGRGRERSQERPQEPAQEPREDRQDVREGQSRGDALGPLRDGGEVEEVRRMTREGLSVREARERVIGARDGGPAVGEGGPDRRRDGRERGTDRGGHAREDEGIGVKQAAQALGISETTVRRRVERGEIEGGKDEDGRLKVRLLDACDRRRDAGEREPQDDPRQASEGGRTRQRGAPRPGTIRPADVRGKSRSRDREREDEIER